MDENILVKVGFVFCEYNGREAYHYFGKNKVFTAYIERDNLKPYYAIVFIVCNVMQFDNPDDRRNGKYATRWLTDEHNEDRLIRCLERYDR